MAGISRGKCLRFSTITGSHDKPGLRHPGSVWLIRSAPVKTRRKSVLDASRRLSSMSSKSTRGGTDPILLYKPQRRDRSVARLRLPLTKPHPGAPCPEIPAPQSDVPLEDLLGVLVELRDQGLSLTLLPPAGSQPKRGRIFLTTERISRHFARQSPHAGGMLVGPVHSYGRLLSRGD